MRDRSIVDDILNRIDNLVQGHFRRWPAGVADKPSETGHCWDAESTAASRVIREYLLTRGMGKDGDGHGPEWTWIVIKKHPREEKSGDFAAILAAADHGSIPDEGALSDGG